MVKVIKLSNKRLTFLILAFAFLSQSKVFAQSPAVTYSTPQTYTVGTAITSLSPANTGSAVGSYTGITFYSSNTTGPTDIIFDGSGNGYVVNFVSGGGGISEFTASGVLITSSFIPSGTLNQAVNEVFDGSGNLYISDYNNNRVLKYNSSGTLVATVTGIPNPIGITIDAAAANVYVASSSTSTAVFYKIPVTTTGTIAGTSSKTITNITSLWGLAMDSGGNFYVTNTGTTIYKVTSAGTTAATFSAGFSQAENLKFDPGGNLCVGDIGTNTVYKVTPGAVASAIANGFAAPFGMGFDASGNLYVCNYNAASVIKYTGAYYSISPALPAGLSFNTITGVISGTPTATSAATTYTITAVNNINTGTTSGANNTNTTTVSITVNPALPAISYSTPVTFTQNASITSQSPTNTGGAVSATNGYAVSGTALPTGLSLNTTTGVISGTPTATSAATNYTIKATNATGSTTTTINIAINSASSPAISYTTPQTYTQNAAITALPPANSGGAVGSYSNTATTFASPTAPNDVSVDPSGNVYVTFGTSVTFYTAAAGTTKALTGLTSPLGILYEPVSGDVFFCDNGASKIYKYSATGTLVSTITTVTGPSGIAADASGNIYVTSTNGDIYKIPFGTTTATAVQTGFTAPEGVAINSSGDLFVSETGVATIFKIASGGTTHTTFASGFTSPRFMSFDPGGNLTVCDISANTITKLTPAGVSSSVYTGLGKPEGASFDASGNLYVAVNTGNKIQKYAETAYYTVSPTLPAGLALNALTGSITGTPTAVTAAANYTVTAVNNTSGGTNNTSTAGINITVNPTAPAFAYATTTITAGALSTITPTVTGGAGYNTYSISPALPYGLSLSTTTGVISGTPEYSSTAATYTITATNAAAPSGVTGTLSLTIDAYSGNAPYAYSIPLTIKTSSLGVTGTLSNFPFLLSITDPSLVITSGSCSNKVQLPGGAYDFAFVDPSTGNELNYQVDSYNQTTGTLQVWVKLTALSSTSISTSTNTQIYFYFGSPTAPTNHAASFYTSTWSSDYQAIYHFNDATASGSSVTDATSNGKTGTTHNMTSANFVSTGKIGSTYSYLSSASDYITAAALSVNGTGSTTGFTISAWINLSAVGADQKIASDETADGGANGFKLGVYTNNIPEVEGAGTLNRSQGTAPTALAAGAWHYVQGVYTGGSGGTLSTYVDGAQYNVFTVTNNTTQTTTGALGIGYDGPAGNNGYFSGDIDELRISNTAKSANWLLVEYNNQNNPATYTSKGSIAISAANALAITGGLTYTTSDGVNFTYTSNGATVSTTSPSTGGNANLTISGGTAALTAGQTVNALTVNGAFDVLNLGTQTLNVGCAIVNNGTINSTAPTASTLTFNGTTSPQTYTGGANSVANLYNLTLNNTYATTPTITFVSGPVNVYGVVNLTSSNLAITGSTFTLKSQSATQTASIGPIAGTINATPTYSVTGNINAERFVTGGAVASYRGYRTMTSPVSSTGTTGGLINMNFVPTSTIVTGVTLTGVTCSLCTTTGTTSLYLYDEQEAVNNATFISGNFVGVNSINGTALGVTTNGSVAITGSQTLPAGNGFYMFFRGNNTSSSGKTTQVAGVFANPENVVFTSTGVLNQGPITVKDWFSQTSSDLSYTSTTGTVARGFSLVGNPYASSINWDNFSTSNSSSPIYGPNMLGSIYTYNYTTKNYAVYLPGSTVNANGTASGTASGAAGGSNVVPSGQGFFIQVNSAATTSAAQLIFNESAKIATNVQPATLLLNSAPAGLALANKHLRLQLFKDSVNIDEAVILLNQSASPNYVPGEDAAYVKGSGVVSLSITSPDNYALAISSQPLPAKRQVIPLHINVTASGNYQLNLPEVVNIPNVYNVYLLDANQNDSLDFKHNPTYTFTANTSDTTTFGYKRFSLVLSENPAYALHLLSFNGAKATGGSQLTWTTENEDIITTFTLQRSTDGGKTYTALTTFLSNGSGSYSYLDTNPAPGENDYRLQITDVDGAITYSGVVVLTYPGGLLSAIGDMNIYPNPIKDIINLIISSTNSASTTYTITIMESNGTTVKSFTSQQVPWQTNLTALAPGVYLIKVFNNTDNTLVGTNKFIKL